MENTETYYEDLMARYFSGEATPEEVHELSGWVGANPSHASVFRENAIAWTRLTAAETCRHTDLDKEWTSVEAKLPGKGSFSSSRKKSGSVKPDIPHSLLFYTVRWSLRIAAVLIILLIPAYFGYRYFSSPRLTRVTAQDGMLETTLPDGTLVTLNAFSSLEYLTEFRQKSREVTLQGEAFFDVKTNADTPFIVSAGIIRAQATGTSFNVQQEKNQGNVTVVLVDGQVTVYFSDSPEKPKILAPGEKAELNPALKNIVVSPNEDPNFLAWKTYHIVFIDDPLDKILAVLNNVYHANIRLESPALASCHMTATFDQQSLESVLNVIGATLNVKSSTTPAEIVLSGDGCR